jgi:hypothetical protein
MTTKVSGGLLPDFESEPFIHWWNAVEEQEQQQRKEAAAEEAREAALQRLYDAIDANLSPHLQKELAAENEIARVSSRQRADFEAFKAYCANELGTPYLPAAPQSVAMFLVKESERGVAHMSRLRNSIATVHNAVGFGDTCVTDILVRAVLRCVKEEEAREEEQKETTLNPKKVG